jgi:hypothetical protein
LLILAIRAASGAQQHQQEERGDGRGATGLDRSLDALDTRWSFGAVRCHRDVLREYIRNLFSGKVDIVMPEIDGVLSVRMGGKRFARLRLAFSKKLAKLKVSVVLEYAHCNFVRCHRTPRHTLRWQRACQIGYVLFAIFADASVILSDSAAVAR